MIGQKIKNGKKMKTVSLKYSTSLKICDEWLAAKSSRT